MAARKIPTLLNYTRSIVPSEGIFWGIKDGIRVSLPLIDKTVLGTISNYSGVYKKGDKQENEEKINKEMMAGANNIQRVDACHLPADTDTFQLEFTLKFVPNSVCPETCNDSQFFEDLKKLANAYAEKGGYAYLARLYMGNLINGRFLWRNRYGIDRTLTLSAPYDDKLENIQFEITDNPSPFLPNKTEKPLKPWLNKMEQAFSGNEEHFIMKVMAEVTIGSGQEIYPSQEFVERGNKSKTLFTVQVNGQLLAGMHSQKIGNAVRTIDIWYPDAEADKPLAVDPFTVDKRRGKTVRLPNRNKSDFYSYLKELSSLQTAVDQAENVKDIPGEVHYFMAVLIRGGVFSGESEKK